METFSTVDGPGIRFVMFMQGCPLRCVYCQNPDTWNFEDGSVFSVDDILHQLEDQVSFIKKNNGGITASGGEPAAQAGFVGKVFQQAKELFGITTAIDTSGCVPISEEVVFLLSHCDYVLIDVKHVDQGKHVILTGRSRGLVQDFIEYIQRVSHIKIWIRHVVVPGYTTDDADIEKIAKYIRSIKHVERVDLLPYHDMGEFKWQMLHRDHKLKDLHVPSKEMILEIEHKMKNHGVPASSIYSEEK